MLLFHLLFVFAFVNAEIYGSRPNAFVNMVLPGQSKCVSKCLRANTDIGMTPCKSLNASCICGFQNYHQDWTSCVMNKCQPDEIEQVILSAVSECSNLNGPPRPTFSLTKDTWRRLEKATFKKRSSAAK